ncbi:hypothetical protein MCU_00248 [Bartonella elizabethae Re6043vi]|uniref:Uncharacterized protein n=2 Tax=Bartonella elizabethae TaxID=807 RepID=J1KDJ1_BAREL|nr:hypothetical protein [Bartonella elizabethae]EJF84670.1 hypothetical protein MCU_00248 [Bartonella elizabethae Re6043vi]EJF95892.1 hypothetical protein MEE_00817 [Bartonella elizabethae F9251 = ATCC 49927]VEJ41096.1 Uncharacterised protein [Bartonella elizabethae]VEJ41446.1 Uncharacterised protein [Bartonella elizabethae]
MMETILKWISALDTTVIAIFNGIFLFWFRKKDLERIDKQFKYLEDQNEIAKKHLSVLLSEKKMRELGSKLQVYNVYRGVHDLGPKYPNDIEINMGLVLYNSTKQIIKINSIRIAENSSFQFIEAYYLDSPLHIQKFAREKNAFKIIIQNSKHIDLINPILRPEPKDFFDLFSMNGDSEFSIILTLNPEQPQIRKPITIIVEHTAPNNPEETLEATFCLGFFRWTEEQNSDFWNRFKD